MTGQPLEQSPPELEKARQVFRFLKAFAERGNPPKRKLSDQPWILRLAELPVHQDVTLGEVDLATPGEGPTLAAATADGPPLLRVGRPDRTQPPRLPQALLEWLEPGWDDPGSEPRTVRERNERVDGETVTVSFSDSPERMAALETWTASWERWAAVERPVRATIQLFERLFELRGRISLDSERFELMLGDGRLRWSQPDGDVDHPILLQRVELEFDPGVPEIRVTDADRAPELFTGVFQGSDGMTPETMTRLRQELEQGGYHPLNRAATSTYLRRIVQLLSPRGMFRDDSDSLAPSPDPVLSRDPVLFLRARMSGFPAAFDWILEDLERRGELPVGLTRLVGVTPAPPASVAPEPRSPWGEPPDVLLSKPANPEQIQIARALESHRAVLVQGPPGTGKSHTIANLIGHLVAHGKRVLVTSHTTKALRVLRGQIVETLRPLSVAVLETDLEARTQMEQSVKGILARLTTANEESLKREVADFATARAELNGEIDRLTGKLSEARDAEYLPIIIAGESISPSDAARWVRQNESGNDWVPGPVESGAPLPLSPEEISELYSLASKVSAEEEGEIQMGLPEPAILPSSSEFVALVRALEFTEVAGQERFWERPANERELPALEVLARTAASLAAEVGASEPWQKALVAVGHAGGVERDLWLALQEQVVDAQARWEKARPVLLDHQPEVQAPVSYEDTRKVVGEIVRHLESGGTLGTLALLFHPAWKALKLACKVSGRQPETAAHFRALGTMLTLEDGRRKLAQRWTLQAEGIGLPAYSSCGATPEPVLRQYADQFPDLLNLWPSLWQAVRQALEATGMKWDHFRAREVARSGPSSPFDLDIALLSGPLQEAINARLALARKDQAQARLVALEGALESYRGPVCGSLLLATRERDPASYDAAREQFLDLASRTVIWERRRELLARMKVVAPEWARAIHNRTGAGELAVVPGDLGAAWRWRQLRQEIDRRALLDEQALTRLLGQRRDELRRTTAELIDRRAWLGQLRRTDLAATQALQGWAQTVKKIGRGTGKRAPEHQRKARELLGLARDAVPVWIMPLDRVTESFDPRKTRFDVVIVDEASQSDVRGLLAWYLGDRVAIVGDHEQVSPLAVGQAIEPIRALVAEHLGGIPNSHLYDGTTSIYDLARTCFGGTIALREHFRCVPDIIEFSNRLSYEGEIRPLRNPAVAPLPHVVEYVVGSSGGLDRNGKTNLGEARVVVALIKAMTGLPPYTAKSLGAVTLLGDEQAGLIQDLAVSVVGAIELEQRRFASGNPGQFQGDERDVMLLSMVDVPEGRPLRLRQLELFKQRYNVAASRAKDQMWLVHSLDPARDLQANDLRRRLIEHVRDPGASRRAVRQAQQQAESPFEAAVIERLINRGFRVEPQVWVGRYRIDMLVGEGTNQIALECDGDRFHGVEQTQADMIRQAILERAGWRFIRVRGTRFYRDPDGTTEWILSELARHGVSATGAAPGLLRVDQAGASLREAVIRRAHEIMREQGWLPPIEATDPVQTPELH